MTSAYPIVPIANNVNKEAEILPTLSPKLSKPIASDPKMTVKFNHERKVLSLAKKTFGSTRVGNAILLPGTVSIKAISIKVDHVNGQSCEDSC